MALGDHLGADQQVDLSGMQRTEHSFQIVPAAHRIAIQPANPRLGKHRVQDVLQLLRAGTEILNVFAAALGTRLGRRPHKPAVVADEPVLALVVGHGDGAVLALHRLPALAAEHE